MAVTMTATFIVSLDCEGKWGMADHLTADHHRWLTSARLRDAYRRLLDLFGEHQIDATFAFVMAFLLTPEEQRERDALFQDQPIDGRNWLVNFREAQREGNLEGWTMPELLDMVGDHAGHEIGCHGFSHLPLDPDMVPADVAEREIAAAAAVADSKGVELATFVYPRNLVGYPEALGRHGYLGFRDRLPSRPGAVGRVGNLLAEFNVAQPPQPHSPAGQAAPLAIPAGFFLNWRVGARRLVPRSVSLLRWQRMLDKAARTDAVVHLWLHPHNIISAPDTFDLLRDILHAVRSLRERGMLEVRTQERYCAARTTA